MHPSTGGRAGIRSYRRAPHVAQFRADQLILRNRLLLTLAPEDRQAVLAGSEVVPMAVGNVVQEPPRGPEYAYP